MAFEQSSSEGEEGVSNVSHVTSILDKGNGNGKCEVHMEDMKERQVVIFGLKTS